MGERTRDCIFNNPKLLAAARKAGLMAPGEDPIPCGGSITKHHVLPRRDGGKGVLEVVDQFGRTRKVKNIRKVCQRHHDWINQTDPIREVKREMEILPSDSHNLAQTLRESKRTAVFQNQKTSSSKFAIPFSWFTKN